METVITYIANDGTKFNNEQDCAVYEVEIAVHKLREEKNINNAIALIRNHCNQFKTCRNCFAYNGEGCSFHEDFPCDWQMKTK